VKNNHRKPSIRINSKKVNRKPEQPVIIEDEVAAALDRTGNSEEEGKEFQYSSNEEDPPKVQVLQRPYTNKSSIFAKIPRLKHLLVAGASATIVGVILGFIMLKLFSGVGIEDEAQPVNGNTNNNNPGVTDSVDDDPEPSDSGDVDPNSASLVSYTYDGYSPQVVQIGYFTTEEKAKEWNAPFEAKNLEPFIWERENHYYVFVGLSMTKESADKTEATIKEMLPEAEEAFDKSWPVTSSNKETTEEEGNWIKEGMSLWQEIVSDLNGQSILTADMNNKLKTWYDKKPSGISDAGETFSTLFGSLLESNEQTSEWRIHNQLLAILHGYEIYLNE
jgi:stage II sporulation protein B